MTWQHSSFGDWLASDQFTPLFKEHKALGTVGASLTRVEQDVAGPDPATPDFTIQLVLRGTAAIMCDYGAGRFSATICPGDFGVSPYGVPLHHEGRGRMEFLVLAVPGSAIRRTALEATGREITDLGKLHGRFSRDPQLATVLSWLWSGVESGSEGGKLFIDAGLSMVTARLLTLAFHKPVLPVRGGLAPAALRRILECMDAHLSEDFGLNDLAAIAGLSPNHFCTAFRQSTGESPHRYLMRRRIERACEMLADPRLPITEVALACGFASSAHFATAFRKAVGTTPSAYRRERLR